MNFNPGAPPRQTNQLLQAQFAAGLQIRKAEKTGNFYKHIYINSEHRRTGTSNDFEIFLQNEIMVPSDGNTRLKIHRALIPMTFPNIVMPLAFTLTTTTPNAVYNVNIPVAYYDPSRPDPANPGFNYGVLDRIRIQLGANFNVTVNAAQQINFQTAVPTANMSLTFGGNAAEQAYCKRVLGFDPLVVQGNVYNVSTDTAGLRNITGLNIFGPYYYSEVFIRINTIPINYDMVDSLNGAPTDILAIVPSTVDTFGQLIVVSQEDSMEYTIAPNSRISRIGVKLTYRDPNLPINLQGQDWSMILSVIKENKDDTNPAQLRDTN
jgi:hypothetical protein